MLKINQNVCLDFSLWSIFRFKMWSWMSTQHGRKTNCFSVTGCSTSVFISHQRLSDTICIPPPLNTCSFSRWLLTFVFFVRIRTPLFFDHQVGILIFFHAGLLMLLLLSRANFKNYPATLIKAFPFYQLQSPFMIIHNL